MNIRMVDYRKENAALVLAESFNQTGFAVITHHPIKKELIDQVYDDWRTFFNSPEKQYYLFDVEQQDGFFPAEIAETAKGNHVKDLKEFYHFYAWGRKPSAISSATLQMYHELNNLGATLLAWLEDQMPADISAKLSQPLSTMIENSRNTLFRIIHYPPLTGSEQKDAVRAAAHEDINLITLLPAATMPGLQVLDKQNNWHDVPCDYNSIVVNAGDMLQMCTKSYYRSTTHRVTNPQNATENLSRLSMPLFLHACPDVRMSKNYTAQQYLDERLREIGLK